MLSTKQNYLSQNPLLIQAANNAIQKRIERERTDAVLMAQRAGITPDAWQSELLRSDAKQLILNCSRQAGKSTVTSVLGLHTALYQPDSLVLLLAPSLRQAEELFRKLQTVYNDIETPILPTATQESAREMGLSNGSRVIALPGNEATIRGFSGVALLIVDEASRVPDALYQAIRPMLAVSGGRIVLLSTPFGKRGFFHSEWTEGQGWMRTKITADQCPRIDKQWLERERQMIGDWWYRQEYFCEFVETDDSVFSYDDIQAAIDPNIKPLFERRN
jgi:hypothetical protein